MNQQDLQKANSLSNEVKALSRFAPVAPKPTKPKDLSFIRKFTAIKQPEKPKNRPLIGDYVLKFKEKPQVDSPETIVAKINASSKKISSDVIEGLMTPADVVEEIKNLKGNDRIDVSHIRNGEQLARLAQKMDMNDMRWHGGGLSSVIHDTSLTGSGTVDSPLSVVATPTGITIIAVAGTIDDSNMSFTSASQPTLLVINGMIYQKTAGAITWTYVAGTITLSIPVGTSGSIFGLL